MKASSKMISIYPGYPERMNKDKTAFFDAIGDMTGRKITPFSCGRAAMVYGLRSLGIGRKDEILVPPWLGQCVLSALSRTAFPTMTPSHRTKAILVYHQFGYPQHLEKIEKVASENRWIILNDCANTIFSKYEGRNILEWGDFSILSFSKLYPCALGGALVSSKNEIQDAIDSNHENLSAKHEDRSNMAHGILENAKRDLLRPDKEIEIDAVYGYLPELVAFPSNAFKGLPNTSEAIEKDIDHRKQILDIVGSYFSGHVPECFGCDVAPFAVPIAGPPGELELISRKIKEEIGVDVPVLHFDFDRNMLTPNYRKALVIGCHKDWREKVVRRTCEFIKKERKIA